MKKARPSPRSSPRSSPPDSKAAQADAAKRSAPSAPELNSLLGLVGFNIRRADILMHQHFARTLAKQAIRPAEYAVMTLIAASDLATQADIAQALNIKRPNLVGLILRLERRGVVGREVYARDRRSHVLSLTREGKLLLARMTRLVRDQDRRVTQCWSDAEREQLIGLLQRLHGSEGGRARET